MSRLTYKSKDGSWGLKGLSWEQLVALPPRVYGALAKLKQMEDLVDDIGGAQPSVGELALEELLRGVLADARLLTRREWRAIGRALDRAERQEGANGKSN